MKHLLIIMSCSLFLQACVAVPPVQSETKSTQHADYKDKYADRFSTKSIKQRREQEYANKLVALNKINPIQDAQRAAASDNYYFLVYQTGRGGALKVPGLTQQQSQNTRCRLKYLDGMGDSIFGMNHRQYRIALRKYANQFNKKMFSFCR